MLRMKKRLGLQCLAADCSRLLQHVLPCVNTTVVNRQLARITTRNGMVAVGRLQMKIICHANVYTKPE